MSVRLSEVLRMDGTIDRWPYFILGSSLGLLKMVLDHLVATKVFGRSWTPFDYVVPGQSLFALDFADRLFFRSMLLMALPFIACGVGLTIQRLRSAGLPLYAVVLFFAPMPMNLLAFLALSLVPARPLRDGVADVIDEEWRSPRFVKRTGALAKAMPEDRMRSALMAILIPFPFALVVGALSFKVLQNYGWSVFVGIPFALPMISVILYGYHSPRRLSECLWLGMLWLLVACVACLVLAFEGIICLVMALPLAVPVVLLGSAIGYLIQTRHLGSSETTWLLLVLMAALPAMVGAESVARPEAPRFAVHTSVEIEAPPEAVWGHVIRFDPLPKPDDWVFRSGLAYPVRAVIEGEGVGAIRRCEFSTGPFIEPIEVWDQPRLLRFAVTSNPPPMREWNPFAEIHPPHLDGFLVARRGQFRLVPTADGRTLLEGTTWYQHHLWPAAYWRLWSDAIIHRIHQRVLNHIKRSAELETARTTASPMQRPKTPHSIQGDDVR
jgi:hypothetical protein